MKKVFKEIRITLLIASIFIGLSALAWWISPFIAVFIWGIVVGAAIMVEGKEQKKRNNI